MLADRTVGSLIFLTGATGRCKRRAGTLSLLGSLGIAGAMQKAVNYALLLAFPLCETLRERLYSIKAIATGKGGYASL